MGHWTFDHWKEPLDFVFCSLDHFFLSWSHYKRGKHKRKGIQNFERFLEDHIFQLQNDLLTFQYQHGLYDQFYVTDPKQRHISKASVRDRLVHQIIYSTISPILIENLYFTLSPAA